MRQLKRQISRLALPVAAVCACWSSPTWGLTAGESSGLRERYVETLQVLATEGIETAAEALIELETEVAQQQGASGLDQLRLAELEVADELTRTGANLLLPVMALHERAHLAYRQQALEANPYHARTTIYLQALLYSERLASTGERGIASDLFASLAGYFQEGSPGPGAVALYVRALQFNPDNEAALLGLATAREQVGRYRNALALLERLVETGSANAEARLRLALNLDRLGRRGEAVRILESLTTGQAPDWVLILAFQQLARIRMDQERLDSAHRVLGQGLSSFPGEPALAVGLAYVEERLGLQPDEPLSAEAFKHDAGDTGSSARYLYARPRYEYFDDVRERLRERALQNLPALAQALSTGSGGP
jgi:tetratricopeptide (TPR) repeat protein